MTDAPAHQRASMALDRLAILIEQYCTHVELSVDRVSTLVFGRGAKGRAIIAGTADVNTGTYERAVDWFDVHWPDGKPWPEGVDRPSLSGDALSPKTGSHFSGASADPEIPKETTA